VRRLGVLTADLQSNRGAEAALGECDVAHTCGSAMSTETHRTFARLAVVMTDVLAVRVTPCVRHMARVISDASGGAVVLSRLCTPLQSRAARTISDL